MSIPYPHTHIWINGRKVSVKAIIEDKTVKLTTFETSTFHFVREWLTGAESFELHTSGSTGTPKQITATRHQMRASAELTAQLLRLDHTMSALVALDTRYIAGKMMLVRSFETGMKIFAVEPIANPLVKIPVHETIHFTALVPYQLKTILESKHPHLLDALLTCIIGGAPLDENTIEKLQSYTVNMYATYGMTETLSHIALQPVNGNERSAFFHTLPGISVYNDTRNCLVARVPFLPGDIITNDLAEIPDEGRFRWLGRWDNVINSGGVKVSAEELEKRIGKIFTRLDVSNRFFVCGVPDEKLGEKISLVLEAPAPGEEKMRTLRSALVHSFSPFEIPKNFFLSASFVFTNTAKINRVLTFQTAKEITLPGN